MQTKQTTRQRDALEEEVPVDIWKWEEMEEAEYKWRRVGSGVKGFGGGKGDGLILDRGAMWM